MKDKLLKTFLRLNMLRMFLILLPCFIHRPVLTSGELTAAHLLYLVESSQEFFGSQFFLKGLHNHQVQVLSAFAPGNF